MDLLEFAEQELDRYFEKDDNYDQAMRKNVMDVIELLASQGHSGFTGPLVMRFIERLWNYKPLSPLTGEDDEWLEKDPETGTRQNRRCPEVFQNSNGKVYQLDTKIFVEPDGAAWVGNESCEYIKEFPYMPPDKPEYIYLKHYSNEKPVKVQLKEGTYSLKKPKEFEKNE